MVLNRPAGSPKVGTVDLIPPAAVCTRRSTTNASTATNTVRFQTAFAGPVVDTVTVIDSMIDVRWEPDSGKDVELWKKCPDTDGSCT